MKNRKESDMRRLTILLPAAACFGLLGLMLAPNGVRAQGKNSADWMTANATPQRDAWVRTDPQFTKQNMQNMKGFGVVRKVQLGGTTGQTAALPAFSLLANARGGYGFKSIGYITDASGNALGIDSDIGIVFWKTPVSPAPSGVCSGVLSAGVASVIPLNQSGPGRAGGGGGRGAPANVPADFPGRGKSGAMVGGPDEGAPSLKYYGINAAPAAAGGRGGAPGASGAAAAGGPGRAGGAVTGGTVGAFPYPVAIPFPQVTIGGTGGRGGAGTPGVFVLTADGNARSLSQQMGYDVYMPPTKFLPANSNAFGLIALDSTQANSAGIAAAAAAAAAAPPAAGPGGGGGGRGGGGGAPILYAATSNACGGTAGVWALNLSTPDKTVTSWKTNGGSVAGTAGMAIGNDGTLYAATADGEYTPAAYSDSVVALEAGTLRMTDFFTPGKSEFVSSPVVMDRNGKDLIAVMNRDGKMYLLDNASLGGADHKTPLSVSAKFANITTALPGALASWQDTDGTRWVLTSIAGAPASTAGFQTNGNVTTGAIVALKVVDQGGKATLQPGWVSRDITSPLPPIVVNGVVFAAGTGPQGNAVLYALDGSTGREFLNTGNAMTAAPKGALSAQFSTVYVQTADNVLWSLGFPQDKEDYGALSR
jgi:hypothetical protein